MTPDRRAELEQRIVKAAAEVPVDDPSHSWLNGPELERFKSFWYDLEKYYETSDDSVVSTEVMSESIRIYRAIRYLACDCTLPPHIRERAAEELGILELAVQQALWEGVNNHYHSSSERHD